MPLKTAMPSATRPRTIPYFVTATAPSSEAVCPTADFVSAPKAATPAPASKVRRLIMVFLRMRPVNGGRVVGGNLRRYRGGNNPDCVPPPCDRAPRRPTSRRGQDVHG